MLVSLEWLKQYVDINETPEQLDNGLTMIGQEVEAISNKGKHLDKVVVGKILEKDKHPDSENLSLCKVDVGTSVLQIICGAKNHKAGDKVAVAVEGAVLPGDFKIKKSKIRGVESFGMLCSEKELAMSESHEGIIILPEDAPVGEELRKYLDINDIVFELEITPNRPDCLSHIGVAREIAAYYNRDLKLPEVKISETSEKTADLINVSIESAELCKRYAARIVKNVKVGESPEWLKKRLAAVELRSINNIVDVTNYLLMEYGHPLHAFDYNKLEGKTINVRQAKAGEKITTLDDAERELNNGELLITDGAKGVAIAGVMGGANSEVDTDTKDILIEVAYFTPENIRKTSKRLGLSSDSSYRFERGIDIYDTETVINRAAQLIQEVAGGEITQGIVDVFIEKPQAKPVVLNLTKLDLFVGKKIERERIEQILTNLKFDVKKDGDNWTIVHPTWRLDIERTADIYEEIIRMYGFENIEAVMPSENIAAGETSQEIRMTAEIKKFFVAQGLQEVINYSFIPENALHKIKSDRHTIKIKNPINEDMVVMRPTILYSLIANMRDNFNRNIFDMKIFEVSRVFLPTEEKLAKEPSKIALAIGGRKDKNLWNGNEGEYDFYDLKGYIENFFEYMGIKNYSLERSTNPAFHPGRAAEIYIGRENIGVFGEVHPDVADNMELKEKVYAAELDMAMLIKFSKNRVSYKRIGKYPAVERDIAVVLKEEAAVGTMMADIKKAGDIIEKVELFDVYRDGKLGAGNKSVAINILFRSNERTLVEEEVTTVMNKILETIDKKYGGKLRTI